MVQKSYATASLPITHSQAAFCDERIGNSILPLGNSITLFLRVWAIVTVWR
jgi:hypothetical protein